MDMRGDEEMLKHHNRDSLKIGSFECIRLTKDSFPFYIYYRGTYLDALTHHDIPVAIYYNWLSIVRC